MILYLALIREVSPISGERGPAEQWFNTDFDTLMAQIGEYGRIVTLHEIDFTAGTVREFVDAEATLEAWKLGEDYELSPAGLYDSRMRTVFAPLREAEERVA